MPRLVFWVTMTILAAIAACDNGPGTEDLVDEGTWYVTGNKWPHDGEPFESEHFIVYSDAAAPGARRTVAEIGEDLLTTLKSDFEIESDTLFVFPDGQPKIHIYAYKDHFPQQWGGQAYYGGLLIFSLDHPERTAAGNTEIGNYTRVVKHELVHVIEGLLMGSYDERLVDSWFSEGLAEYVSEGTADGSITTLARFEELADRYGGLNPIAIDNYQYPSIELVAFRYYYPMFELAVGYLLEPHGLGVPKRQIRDLYLDIRGGAAFGAAFENRTGLSLETYENEFFDRMRQYLVGK